jgi:predicted nuclease of predicted toxin-antitoxin system
LKLLFDQNLSPRLEGLLEDSYPGSKHVHTLFLDRAPDELIWEYALQEDFLIVTKDADFSDRSVLRGFPPKVIWLRLGNCTTGQIEDILRRHHEEIKALAEDSQAGVLSLF